MLCPRVGTAEVDDAVGLVVVCVSGEGGLSVCAADGPVLCEA